MNKYLKNEVNFVKKLTQWLSSETSDEERIELETLFSLDYGGLVNACNRYLQRTCKAIKKGYMSLEGFTVQDAMHFKGILEAESLDSSLQNELSHLLYGGDERPRFFS